jgi:thymidylate synthase (FAD)
MKVNLIAYTVVNEVSIEDAFNGFKPHLSDTDPDFLAETGGRLCYLSWDRPNPKTSSNRDYLNNVISQGHESVLAHASASFAIQGVSRNLTHELIRSRFLAFSELSQRYVDASEMEFITPPAYSDLGNINNGLLSEMSKVAYEEMTQALTERGCTRKQAREAARSMLLSSTETKIIASGNLRAWRDFIKQRLTKYADAEIQDLAYVIAVKLESYAPNTMQDLRPLIEEYEARN